MNRLIAVALLSVSLVGCLSPRQYVRPVVQLDQQWPWGHKSSDISGIKKSYENQNCSNLKRNHHLATNSYLDSSFHSWKKFFLDPQLQKFIELSLNYNQNLKIATYNIEQARLQYQLQTSELLPSIKVSTDFVRQKTASSLRSPTQQAISKRYEAGIGFNAFELDLFGQVKSLRSKQLEIFLSTEQNCQAIRLILISEVANAYVTCLNRQEYFSLSKLRLRNREKLLQLFQKQFDEGYVSKSALHLAYERFNAAQFSFSKASLDLEHALNGLYFLVGSKPEHLLQPDSSATILCELIPVGLPSELLERRPDILQAEYELRAAHANIEASRATFFPKIALTGSFGAASTQLSQLFKAGSLAWAWQPQLLMPIFDFGRNRANLDLAVIEKNIFITKYERAIQTAFRETSDALAARQALKEQCSIQNYYVHSQFDLYQLGLQRYQQGLDPLPTLLDLQDTWYSSQQQSLQSLLAYHMSLITLYKALGGYWDENL
jgi:multidrug efflux system outer membrane protein